MDILSFAAIQNPAAKTLDLWIREGNATQNVVTNVSLTIESSAESPVMTEPSMRLSRESAQSLMDALWDAGVKPSGGEGHTAHIRALNAHLEDMRTLVFKSAP